MQAAPNILNTLNSVLTTELTSINRYFLHARMYRNWGFENLNNVSFKKSIKDMKQADELIERILMLGGLPNLQKLEALHIGENTQEMLACDEKFQIQQVAQLKDAVAVCETAQDYVSRNILNDLLAYEEDYLDWIETQQQLISTTGAENYLQSQISKGE
ncbi:bacterioferritin [Marinagarivorans algicola]|uniref:bacterioferritin n=1 Tax=Marinagarivorans algicola TaxID=1513270 RepID=UPI0006B69A40|nr:bacterioferritin [Marinagarivorans algicola]